MEKADKNLVLKTFFKPLDFCVIAVFITVIVFSFCRLKSAAAENLHLLVQTPSEQFIYPLEKDSDFFVQGENGITHIRIKEKAASILDSECPNKTCVTSGEIKKYGEWIACIPNRVVIRIEGKTAGSDKNKLDALSF